MAQPHDRDTMSSLNLSDTLSMSRLERLERLNLFSLACPKDEPRMPIAAPHPNVLDPTPNLQGDRTESISVGEYLRAVSEGLV